MNKQIHEKRILLLIICCFLFLTAVHIYGDKNSGGSFRFAHLLYETRPESGKIQVDKTHRDIIKIFFQPLNSTYLYLLLVSPSFDLQILSPEMNIGFEKNYAASKQFISSNNNWFPAPDGEGHYSLFYLFAQNRLSGIEKHLRNYSAAGSDDKKIKIVKRILSEIRQMRREIELVSNIADLPALIVGAIRNEENKVDESLMKLHFSEEDLPEKKYPVPGFTDSIIERLEESAVTIQFCDIYIKEIEIEYHDR